MAGFYADVPGVRIPYHVDGTLVRYSPGSTTSWINHSGAEAGKMNDGDVSAIAFTHSVTSTEGQRYIAWVFPHPINITGHNIHMSYSGSGTNIGALEYSTNTIDGGDGTWPTTPLDMDTNSTNAASLRSITAVNLASVTGFRVRMIATASVGSFNWRDIAFYGTWAPATLTGWHPTLDQQIPAAHLDYGDIALGAVVVKQFRIKNGRTLQANNVVVSAPVGNTQTATGLTFSLDNSTFSTSVNISSIAAGAISPVIYVKRTVGMAETVGNVGIAPIQFVATTWT